MDARGADGTIDFPTQWTRDLPSVVLPKVPAAAALWSRTILLGSILFGLYLLDKVALLLMDMWLLQSLGFENVFWVNFRTQATLFGVGLVAVTIAIVLPVRHHALSSGAIRMAWRIGLLGGLMAGYLFTAHYQSFLLAIHGQSFGESDPVFNHDLSFYVFDLPAITTSLHAAMIVATVLLTSSMVAAYLARTNADPPENMKRLTRLIGTVFSPLSVGALIGLGALTAARIWIGRYGVLTRPNLDSSIANGADYLDVTGFFSTVNGYTVSALAVLFCVVALALRLAALHRTTTSTERRGNWRKLGAVSLLMTLVPGLAIDSAFRGMVALRNETQVAPNEPVIQLDYIERHIDATNKAFGLDQVEVVDFDPNGLEQPAPSLSELLESPTIKNAPLWPGYVSWLERLLDPQHSRRILKTQGDSTIYGPTLDVLRQEEKLRPYYDFLDVDTVRYEVDGEERLFFSSSRELPLLEPQPWLSWWGQRFVLFTHGHGLVMGPVSQVNSEGSPVYESNQIPIAAKHPELTTDNPAIYYGEGSGTIGFSNVNNIAEHDYPTEQGRAEVLLPSDVNAGVKVDSLLKRLVFGWKAGQLSDIALSDLITSDTRIHYFRTPMERLEHVAPFLHVDTDPYAVVADDGISWMVNGMTVSDKYPYSAISELGDKSHARSPVSTTPKLVNYVADSVKGTVDAYTGEVALYKFADEPIVDTWAQVYPGLFDSEDSMPADVRDQVQYPVQLFHVQFDDLYITYHMTDPLTYFSFEDAYDDADEVVGSGLGEGEEVSFSIEPYNWLIETGEAFPSSTEDVQFGLSAVFTPEGAPNLRAIASAYQTGEDYGRLSVLSVPKGDFYPGPEQADSAIDQDPFISQEMGLWNRRGLEVLRGHTTPLVVGNDVIYVEPLFIRSKQNPIPQMKRVVVVYRNEATMGATLEDALELAVTGVGNESGAIVAGDANDSQRQSLEGE